MEEKRNQLNQGIDFTGSYLENGENVHGIGLKIDIANIYLGILLHYLLVLAAVLIFGYAFNWGNQLPVYVLAGMCGVVLILCFYLDISRVKADIDEINGLCENRV